MKVAILRDNQPESSLKWEIACNKQNIEYISVNMLRHDWLSQIMNFNPNFCVSRPPGDIQQNKKLFDEKLFFLENFTPCKVFPGFLETFIYENKSALAWFLKTNNIPHPKTFISACKEEALDFVKNSEYPLVAKTLIGAAGSGVKVIRHKEAAISYVEQAFRTGIKRRFGPNRKTGTPVGWARKAIKSPKYFLKKLQQYKAREQDVQKGIVLFQEYIPHNFEWRCVKIGESYFAYKKMRTGDKASGVKQFEYGPPPLSLLDFTKKLCGHHDFYSMAVDIFYHDDQIYVNELQTIFGHKNPYICKVDERPGRFICTEGQWLFEEGDFNINESYDLRLHEILNLRYKIHQDHITS